MKFFAESENLTWDSVNRSSWIATTLATLADIPITRRSAYDFVSKKWKSWVSTFLEKLSEWLSPWELLDMQQKYLRKASLRPLFVFQMRQEYFGKSEIQWDEIYCEVAFLIYLQHCTIFTIYFFLIHKLLQ